MEKIESELIKRLLAKDRLAARTFYQTYTPKLLRFIHTRIASEQDTEEIAQDTLFAFLEGIRDFTHKCSLSTYLCSIASNKIIDYYRKRKLKRIVFSQLPAGLEPLVSELTDPQKILDRRMTSEKITTILRRLSPHYARILKLKYIEGRSVAEIAKILTCSFKSVESSLFRARKAFVKLYITL